MPEHHEAITVDSGMLELMRIGHLTAGMEAAGHHLADRTAVRDAYSVCEAAALTSSGIAASIASSWVFAPKTDSYALSIWWSGGSRRRGLHDTFYDNVPISHANYNAENMPFCQENPLISGLVYAWQCGGQGFESP
jgi:hypothetical protein